MRNRLLSAGLVLGLLWGTANAAVINLVDGWSGVYDPANTYVPTGVIGPEIYSFQFYFTDPTHKFEVTLQVPTDLPGPLGYHVSAGLDGTGIFYFGNTLFAGDSITFEMGNIVGATDPGIPQALSLVAPSVTDLYELSGTSAILVSDFGSSGNGNGSGNSTDPTGQVATPTPLLLLLSVLAGLALRSFFSPPATTCDPAPRLVPAA